MPFNDLSKEQYNSELVKLLTENLPDMLWIKDVEGHYIYANRAICEGLLMAKDTEEPIGKTDVFFALREREAHSDKPDWHTFGELCHDSDKIVIKNNKSMRFEEFGNVKGKMLILEVNKAPFYDDEGNIIGVVGTGRDITKLKQVQTDLQESLNELDRQKAHLQYQSTHGALTGLPNRTLMFDRLEQSINIARRNGNRLAVIFLDLDHFKKINDSLGHDVGDQVLIEISDRMKKRMRETDTLARLGGDEFCIILNNIDTIDHLTDIIIKEMVIFNEPLKLDNNTIYLGGSVGISLYPDDGDQPVTLLRNADVAMYRAKSNGRNTYAFYDNEMSQQAFERLFLETALREAIDKDEFFIHYQPQVDIRQKKVIGLEALVRRQHGEFGLITPDKFIPLAEDTGMIVQLDRQVMRKAIAQVSQWNKEGLDIGRLSLNLAIKQMEQDDFIDFVKTVLDEYDCDARQISFEVTESQIMRYPERSINILQQLNDLGVTLSVDDFGTGYSSLTDLKRLPINKLKIDRSFIQNLPGDPEDVAITRAIISLAKSLNLECIAEGVETDEQNNFLLQNGCLHIQGYLYAKPMNASDIPEFLKSAI